MSDTRFTPGPWQWFGNVRNKQIYLATQRNGRRFVMDFVRFGMHHAAPRFQKYDERGNGLMYRVDELSLPDHNGNIDIMHPDALLIAAAPDMFALLERVCNELPGSNGPRLTMLDEWRGLRARINGGSDDV